jgi:hypothetical protein
MRPPRLELGPRAEIPTWEARILPLNYERSNEQD